MIITHYRSPGAARARYIRQQGDHYRWCEQSAADSRVDVAQGTCDADDLPPDVADQCMEYRGAFYAAEWPL